MKNSIVFFLIKRLFTMALKNNHLIFLKNELSSNKTVHSFVIQSSLASELFITWILILGMMEV